jgi:hypothetical protein
MTNASGGPLRPDAKPEKLSSVKPKKTLVVAPKTQQGGRTELKLTNATGEPILVYVTLGVPPNCVNNVHMLPFVTKFNNDLQGSFTLGANQSVSYTPPGNLGMNGNFSFGAPPNNCPPPEFPKGITLAEFITNNGFQGPGAQETLDISCVDGCNAKVRFSCSGGGSWNAGPNRPNISHWENAGLYENIGRVGVFPYGCDNCNESKNAPSCTHAKGCQPEHMCNVQRDAESKSGGTITVTFLGMIP